jgi:hypothetical protein
MMKSVLLGIGSVILLSGCSTPSASPKSNDYKYAVEVVELKLSEQVAIEDLNAEAIDQLLRNADVEREDYPVVYARPGEPAENDQTESVLLAEDFQIIEGKAVPREKECRLGKSVGVKISRVDAQSATFRLKVYQRKLKGFDGYETAAGTVKIPFFSSREINSELTQIFNTWTVIGASDDAAIFSVFIIRTLPPKLDLITGDTP